MFYQIKNLSNLNLEILMLKGEEVQGLNLGFDIR